MSKNSIVREIEEQNAQDEKWKDYILPEGFVPNKTLLYSFRIFYGLFPLISAVVMLVMMIMPLCAGQSVTSFIADIISGSSNYIVRGVASLLIVIGVVSVIFNAAERVSESLTLDFAGVKKRAIRGAVFSFILAGVVPVVVYVIQRNVLKAGGFTLAWAATMVLMALLNLGSVIAESLIKRDVDTGRGEEPSVLYKSFISVYGQASESKQKKINIVRELVTAVIALAMLAGLFAVPFTVEEDYLTEERVAEIMEMEDPTYDDVLDVLGTAAYGMKLPGDTTETYIFYGKEMDCSLFTGQADLSLLSVEKYAKDKGKTISACIVTIEEGKVIDIEYYEDIS